MAGLPQSGLQLRSTIKKDGTLEVSLAEVAIAPPTGSEVLVRVEASPLNPSDLGLLLGPVDLSTVQPAGSPQRPGLTARIPQRFLKGLAARLDQSMPVGNEGAGVVIAAAARRGLPVALHTPSEVKAAVTGHGNAGKDQIAAMVTRILRLDTPPKPADAADALALAITHAWRGGLLGRGLETGNLTSPRKDSRFPTSDARAGAGGRGATAAQRAWLEAERRSRGSTGWGSGSRV